MKELILFTLIGITIFLFLKAYYHHYKALSCSECNNSYLHDKQMLKHSKIAKYMIVSLIMLIAYIILYKYKL